MNRFTRAGALLAACATILAVSASAAVAKSATMHFFSKGVYTRISDATGTPLSPNSAPAVGDRLSFASNDYVGNHKHHAKHATASDQIVCTQVSASGALCDGQLAIGGSMILGDDFRLDLSSTAATIVKITGGTGRYRHAHGTVVSKPVGNNADLTIKVSY
jgi:hypothetical protein